MLIDAHGSSERACIKRGGSPIYMYTIDFYEYHAQTVPYCAGTRLGIIEWARVLYSINLRTVCIYKTKFSVEIYITINNGTFARPEESNAIISEPPLNSRGPNIIPQGLKASG